MKLFNCTCLTVILGQPVKSGYVGMRRKRVTKWDLRNIVKTVTGRKKILRFFEINKNHFRSNLKLYSLFSADHKAENVSTAIHKS